MWNFEWRALGAASLLGIGLALLMSCSVAERAAGALSAIQRANRLRAQETVSFRFLEPLVHASGELGKALRRLMIGQKRGETFFAHLERKLLVAGDPGGLSAEELLGVALFASLGTTALAGWLLPEEFPIRRATIGLVGFGALAAPYFRLGALREEREREVRRTLPEFEGLLSLCMSAGMDFVGALRTVVKLDRRLLADEAGGILRGLELGLTRRGALAQFAERIPISEVVEFCRVVTQAEEKGVSLAEALEREAEKGQERLTLRAEEVATRAGILLLFPLMLLLVAILLLLVGPLLVSGLGV